MRIEKKNNITNGESKVFYRAWYPFVMYNKKLSAFVYFYCSIVMFSTKSCSHIIGNIIFGTKDNKLFSFECDELFCSQFFFEHEYSCINIYLFFIYHLLEFDLRVFSLWFYFYALQKIVRNGSEWSYMVWELSTYLI